MGFRSFRRSTGAALCMLLAVGGCKLGHSRVDGDGLSVPRADGGVQARVGGFGPRGGGAIGDEDAGVVVEVLGRPGGCDVWDPRGERQLPRNLILVVGDGMGPAQVASARLAAGGRLNVDRLPHHARVVTDSLTTLVSGGTPTDSAAAGTALATGVPVDNAQLGADLDGKRLPSLLDLAQRGGRATGLVTTSYLHDATPMAFAVRVSSRSSTSAILDQLVSREPIDVLMGGGAMWLADGAEWIRTRATSLGYRIVTDATELQALAPADADLVLGLFTAQRVDPPTDIGWQVTPAHRRGHGETDPSLAQMAVYALDRLGRDPDGLFLLIEDENTDELGHLSGSYPELSRDAIAGEVRYLDDAVGAVIAWVDAHGGFADTLLVVTADHETGGYVHDPARPGGGDFATTVHTRTPVDVFARGPGAEAVGQLCWLGDVFRLMSGQLRP